MKKIAKQFAGWFYSPFNILIAFLAVVNLYILLTFAGVELIPLSTMTSSSAGLEVSSSSIYGRSSYDGIELVDEKEAALNEMLAASGIDSWQDRYAMTAEEHYLSSGWKKVRMRVTGYCPCKKCCGKFSDGRTANNHRIRPGDVFVAADKYYPFGTEMIIPGYNCGRPVRVYDRGRVIRGNRLDVFFHSHTQANKWGTKYIDVLVRAN
jgi:3D (Asp-Asp-Asp) domain-containing protein